MDLRQEEFLIKISRLREFLDNSSLSGILLGTQTNFLWLTGGQRNDVLKNMDLSLAFLLITPDKKILFSYNSDAKTTFNILKEFDFELVILDWDEGNIIESVRKVCKSGIIGCDIYFPEFTHLDDDLARIRKDLTEFEIKRVKKTGMEVSMLLTQFCSNLKRGLTENEISVKFMAGCLGKNIRPVVVLVGSDQRVIDFKHPVSTLKKVDKYAVIVIVVEKDGINICLTRSVYFGKVPIELAKKKNIVNFIEANYYYNSLPGMKMNDLLKIGKEQYLKLGYINDWQKHPQGGIIGYKPREIMATSSCLEKLKVNNLLGWNPTVDGAIAEDMIVIRDNGPEQFTIDRSWPFMEIDIQSHKYLKPLIMEIS